MCCEQIERQLGRYVDKELSSAERNEVDAHLESCSGCRAELNELRDLVGGIANTVSANVPASLWERVEHRLDQADRAVAVDRPPRRPRRRGAPWAIAAGVVLAIGLGMFGLASVETTAQASAVDFGVLLDALPLDAPKAFRKFLLRYDAKPTTPITAQRSASALNFATPAVLPGGFQLKTVYEIKIGGSKGIAVAYDRNGEFLAAVFHAPMRHERLASRKDNPCIIGERCCHKVQVGQWKLVHATDPTTCHCLLSRLDEQSEIPAIMQAIAPALPNAP